MKKISAFLSLTSIFLQSYRYAEGYVLHPTRTEEGLPLLLRRRSPRSDRVVGGRGRTALEAVPPTPSTRTENKDGRRSANAAPSVMPLISSSSTEEIQQTILQEAREVWACLRVAATPFLPTTTQGSSGASEITNAIVQICDQLESITSSKANGQDDDEESDVNQLWVNRRLQLRRRALEVARYQLLCQLMTEDYDAYVATATFLSPSRIPRDQLPNVQEVPMMVTTSSGGARAGARPTEFSKRANDDGDELVPDCELDAMVYQDSPLDRILLRVFRNLVERNTGGITSDKPGIEGLLDQGRTFMVLPGQTSEAQHEMVRKTLGGLMTPFLPPFYRIFMAGIVPPKLGTKWDGKQLGPWFYAPWLTSVVTPPFFQFLVGPSTPNRRKDGQLGGLLVQKCKFLQESNCKGLCLHQCKLPAQQFFKDELGLPLTVSPNFVTQECQWSFGEVPLPPADDPTFPTGCLAGCESRRQVSAMISSRSPNGVKASLCSY